MPEAPNVDEAEAVALVKQGYNAIADRYFELARHVPDSHPRRERTEMLLARLPGAADVLELGCGGGLPVARRIVDAGHRYTGVDISERQIALAQQHVPEGEFVVGDIVAVSFSRRQFDAALVLYAITHVPRQRWPVIARKVYEWLKPGGLLLINVPARGSPGWLEEDFLGFGADNWTNALDASETIELLADTGFDVLEAVQLPDDEPGPGWFWVFAQRTP